MRVASLSNPHLHFSLNPTTGRWGLSPHQHETPYFEEARFGAIYEIPPRKSRRTVYWDGELHDSQAGPPAQVDSPHGQLTLLKVHARTPASPHSPASGEGLGWELEFALPADHPFFLWRVTARNLGRQPVALDVIDLLRIGPHFQRRSGRAGWLFRLGTLFSADGAQVALSKTQGSAGALRLHSSPARLAFFSNGYQSWSFAGALQADRHQPSSLFGPLGDPKALNLITPRLRQPGRFTSEMFGVIGDREHNAGVVAGFLSQREQFGAVEVLLDLLAPSMRLTAQCDGVTLAPGQEHATDWAYLQFIALDDPDPLRDYAEAVARENNARVPAHTPVGWCSWYHYFDKVTEDDITNNLAAIVNERDRLPLDFVQLDDGFQAQVGDWFETKPTFPRGLKWLAAEIRAHKQTPGLWLAPYMVRADARLLRQHPNWFLRDARGRLVSAGFNWFKWCYALDPTHPEVREHVRRLITTAVREWGFPYLKLDFLYAAALPAKRHDPALTRAQAMRLALMDIREAAGPDTFILGCGCPLGSAVGLVDGMRISTDVAPDWNPQLFTPRLAPLLHREMDFVGVRNAIRNTINRAPLHRRWWLNDPDCLLVRDHDTHLSEAEIRSLATVIALSGGMFLVSDNMSRLERARHRYIAPLLPPLGASARAPDWMSHEMPDLFILPLSGPIGEWRVAGVFNWDNEPRDRTLDLRALGLHPDSDYLVSDFWEGGLWTLGQGQPLSFDAMPPHGAHLVALRRAIPGPTFVASTFHFSQGGEVCRWEVDERNLTLGIELGRVDEGELRLALPAAPHTVVVDGSVIPATDLGGGIYSLRFAVRGASEVRINW